MFVEHIAIWTFDLERLRDFYVDYFNAEVGPKYENRENGFQSYFCKLTKGARLELMQMPGIVSKPELDPALQLSGLIHLAVAVGSKLGVDNLYAKMKRNGLVLVDEPHFTGDGYYEFTVLDPDGNRIEITI
ncbi:MAG: VOC family protein [Aestuariibacter sp.]